MLFSNVKYASFLSTLILTSTSLTASTIKTTSAPPRTAAEPKVANTPDACPTCEYDHHCCPEKKSSWGTFSARGEFLFWQPFVTGMAYVLTHTNVAVPFGPFGPTVDPDNLSIRNVKFKYGPGYRLGGRYTLPKTAWDFDADYTRFTKSAHDSISAGNGVFLDTLWDALSAINATEASSHLKVKMWAVNATIGKTLPFLHCFRIRPNFGVQIFRIDTHERFRYSGITSVDNTPFDSVSHQQLMNDSTGWGLLVGLDAFWRLPWYFEFFGKANYALLRTKFRSTQRQQAQVTGQEEIDLNSTTRFNAITHSIHIIGGVDWNYQFNCRKHPLAFKIYAGYEMNLWLQDIQLTRVLSLGTGFSDATTTNIGNVGFRGLTAGAEFSF